MDQNKFDLLKSHIDQYTRKDGSVVAAHDDKRVAAQPLPASAVNSALSKHSDKMVRKGTEWDHQGINGKKVPASDVAGFPEFSHKEVYGHDGKTSPAADDFSKEFAAKGHQGFVLKHGDGKRSVVDTQGSSYARYHAPVADSAGDSSAPPLATHADALKRSSKPGDLDHEDNQIAAAYMKDGDHKALASHIKNLDTAARDHILDHVHPDHREGLGFKQLDMARSKKQYDAKFGAKPSKSAKPAKAKKDTPAQADSNSGKWDDLKDDENPKHALSRVGSETLGKVAKGEVNIKDHAHHELASRGLDSDGEWAGFAMAKVHHGGGMTNDGDGFKPHPELKDHMQTIHTKVLSAAAKGHLDLQKQAKHTLASRGQDSDGKWVGFPAAKKHHGIE